MLERVKEIVADTLGTEAEKLTEATSFKADLDADSLDLFEMVMALEEEFGKGNPNRGSGEDCNDWRCSCLS